MWFRDCHCIVVLAGENPFSFHRENLLRINLVTLTDEGSLLRWANLWIRVQRIRTVSPRASTLYWVFKKGNEESNNCARSVRNSSNNRHKWRQIWYVIATFVLLYDTNRFQVAVRLQCVFQKEYDWSPFKLKNFKLKNLDLTKKYGLRPFVPRLWCPNVSRRFL